MHDVGQAGAFKKPIDAGLARVLAEAANSAFAPNPFYIVLRYEPDPYPTGLSPYDVQHPCRSYEEAEQLAEQLERKHHVAYGAFGPFKPREEHHQPQITVKRLLVTPVRGKNELPDIHIDGREYDALFFSAEAVRKFVVPYYAHVVGPDFAAGVLSAFDEAPLALMGHLPWSEEVEIVPLERISPAPGSRK